MGFVCACFGRQTWSSFEIYIEYDKKKDYFVLLLWLVGWLVLFGVYGLIVVVLVFKLPCWLLLYLSMVCLGFFLH